LNGVLDNLRAERLAKRIREYLEKDHGKLILDLENVRASEGKGAKNFDSCSPLSRRDKFRRNVKRTIQRSIPPLGVSVFG